jgi:hypothetical protein
LRQPYGSGGGSATTRRSYVSATETQVADLDTNQSDPVSSVPDITYTNGHRAGLVGRADRGAFFSAVSRLVPATR